MNEQVYNKSPISKPSKGEEKAPREATAKTAAARASDKPASVWSSTTGGSNG